MKKKILVFLVTIILLVGFIVLKEVKAGSWDNVYGWAWSERIGWISFNCYNDYDGDGNLESHCTDAGYNSDYGVDINLSTGVFSGYAWSERIGWISFNSGDLAGCPSAPCEARFDSDGTTCGAVGQVCGWARAYRAIEPEGQTLGGWDGWIKLRGIDQNGDPYGVSFDSDTNEFEGWAWAGNDSSEEAVIGWISFNCKDGGYVEEHFPSITGEASDGFISAYSSSYSTAHSTSDSFNITGSTLRVGQEYIEAGVGECTGTAYDCGLGWADRIHCELTSGCIWVACEGTAATCDSWDNNYGGCLGHDGCYWDGCTGTATDCEDFWSWGSCTGQDGCEWIESGYGDYCDGTPDSCDNYGGEWSCTGQDGCSWDGCSGTATDCDSYDDDWASGLKWACEAQFGCSWPGCFGAPDPCDSFGSESDCNSQPGCSWDEGEDEEFGINRGYLDFDTSSIPDGATITDVKLSLKASQDKSDTNFDIEIYKFNWAEPITSGNRETSYDAGGAVYDGDWRNTSGMSTGVYYDSPSLDNSWVNKTGDTKYQLRSGRDVDEDAPYGDEYIEFYSANSAGNKPILKVTYTIEAAPAGEHYSVCGDSNYKVKSTLNQSPDKPTNLNESWGCCGGMPQVALRTCLILNWSYFDPDGDPQAGYEVWVDESSDFSSPKFNHVVDPGFAPSYTVDLAADDDPPDPGGDWFSKLDWGTTYHWKVRVKDSNGNLSDFSDSESFTMPNRASPNVDFTPNPINPRTGEEVTFIDESKCYLSDDSEYDCDTGGDEITYEWDFDYDGSFDPSDWTKGDTTYTYPETGNYTVRLQVTDSGVGPVVTGMCWKEVIVGFALPTWKEVTPF
ncbi:PKD domain-containing protein [Patescibacteria group bacterium]|nr:PKD domain-containing protein [Patescibacteria group bacterium]